MVERVVVALVMVAIMTAGGGIDEMIWLMILDYIILIIIIIMVVVGIGLVVVTRKLYALYPKNDPFLGHYG